LLVTNVNKKNYLSLTIHSYFILSELAEHKKTMKYDVENPRLAWDRHKQGASFRLATVLSHPFAPNVVNV
jgi:galactose mutarotase-like enzyme